MGGHSDIIGGVLARSDEDVWRLRQQRSSFVRNHGPMGGMADHGGLQHRAGRYVWNAINLARDGHGYIHVLENHIGSKTNRSKPSLSDFILSRYGSRAESQSPLLSFNEKTFS